MAESLVTVVVVPRERFSYAATALAALYARTPMPFDLVYVDGNSPPRVRRHLEAEAGRRGFRLIRTAHYLAPNEARNLGGAAVSTPYVVFLDNDVAVSPGWLEALVDCAERTGAAAVGPLYLIGPPAAARVHMAGGDAHIVEQDGRRRVFERRHCANANLAEIGPALAAAASELLEFHCFLVRTSVLGAPGRFDEQFHSALDDIDFCLALRAQGGTIHFEPRAVVTYVNVTGFRLSDFPFFLLRWSDEWNDRSLAHFAAKWRLDPADPFLAGQRRLLASFRKRPLRHALHRLRLGPPYGQRWETALDRALVAALTRRARRARSMRT